MCTVSVLLTGCREGVRSMSVPLSCASGVYQIRCIPNGKIYVGSAVNLRVRWDQHYRALRRRGHHNAHLQFAWDKYGEASFEFSVLEFVEVVDLLHAKQGWIDKTGCADREL